MPDLLAFMVFDVVGGDFAIDCVRCFVTNGEANGCVYDVLCV